jgi:hypothetical protein
LQKVITGPMPAVENLLQATATPACLLNMLHVVFARNYHITTVLFKKIIPFKTLLSHRTYEETWDIWRQQGFNFFATAIGNHYKNVEEESR